MAIQERQISKDGFEMQMGTNHFGHFVFTLGLIDSLKAAGSSRVVSVSSIAHKRNAVQFDDMDFSENYDPWKAYGQSKTANILFAKELQKRFAGDGITSVSCHPGVIESELWRHTGKITSFNKTIPQGASTSMYCCLSPDIGAGMMYSDCALFETAAYASDMELAAKLWEISEKRTSC